MCDGPVQFKQGQSNMHTNMKPGVVLLLNVRPMEVHKVNTPVWKALQSREKVTIPNLSPCPVQPLQR